MADNSFVGFIWASGDVEPWLPTVNRLLKLPDLKHLYIVSVDILDHGEWPEDPAITVWGGTDMAAMLLNITEDHDESILVINAPVLAPEMGIGPALQMLQEDNRIAGVGFWSNAGGHLSFPTRNTMNRYPMPGHNETTLTRALRSVEPDLGPVPIAAASGPVTLVSRDALILTGGPSGEFFDRPEAAIAEMLLRVSRRGFRTVLDSSTYFVRPYEPNHWHRSALNMGNYQRRFEELHPFFPALYLEQVEDQSAPINLALHTSRAKAKGLRILIDASCVGPIENGTQVQTLALVDALARRDDVEWVGVGMATNTPPYARKVLNQPKVQVIRINDLRFEGLEKADIVHRPFQPGPLPWRNWRNAAHRVAVTVQDLISYTIGAYHPDGDKWLDYRSNIVAGTEKADALIVISHDVKSEVNRERLPISDDRIFVVENGTDHLRGDEDERIPQELVARGWSAKPFIVVLGTDYTHKNRDVALRVLDNLRSDYPNLALVLAGVSVPEGSSRSIEARHGLGLDNVELLPDVTSQERNWLLRHAEICLYPTSAEGFGLVPFEAARFGTPTVSTRFGPLAEVLADVPVAASSWDPSELADCCRQLMRDPNLTSQQIAAILKQGSTYTWDRTAEGLVAAYRNILSRPVR